jgi:hypothetical protein
MRVKLFSFIKLFIKFEIYAEGCNPWRLKDCPSYPKEYANENKLVLTLDKVSNTLFFKHAESIDLKILHF